VFDWAGTTEVMVIGAYLVVIIIIILEWKRRKK